MKIFMLVLACLVVVSAGSGYWHNGYGGSSNGNYAGAVSSHHSPGFVAHTPWSRQPGSNFGGSSGAGYWAGKQAAAIGGYGLGKSSGHYGGYGGGYAGHGGYNAGSWAGKTGNSFAGFGGHGLGGAVGGHGSGWSGKNLGGGWSGYSNPTAHGYGVNSATSGWWK